MENWSRILTCENGEAHVDVNGDERTNLQLVIRGHLLHRLYHAGMMNLQYDQKEFVLRGYHAELQQLTPTATFPASLSGVFYPWDFRKMIQQPWDSNYPAYELERRGGDLILKRLSWRHGESRQFAYYSEYDYGTYHRTYHFEREYLLGELNH